MAILKCKMCGGQLDIQDGQTVIECDYCGTKQTVPTLDNEKKVSLFTRANRLRANCEFDKAYGVYETIVADYPEEAEAYWGLVLCKYGIEYVDDPATGKKTPTCHRSSFDSVMDDSNFDLVLEYADSVARPVYRQEAKVIEEVRKGIIEVSSKEEPYDIFICYKETAEDGQRTLDSVLAQDIYTELTRAGYRVFFSRITLEDKLGQEYEPYIFSALNSAKVMLVFGTDYEYFNAVWVKNEWSRYLKLMAKGEKKTLIPCYKNIDAYDMPKEFAKLQAQDLGKVGATQDLLRDIEKIIPLQKEDTTIRQIKQITEDPLLERAFMFLEDKKWEEAEVYFDKVLDLNPKCSDAYAGLYLVNQKANSIESYKNTVKAEIESVEPVEQTILENEEHIQNSVSKYSVGKYLPEKTIRMHYEYNLTYKTTVPSLKTKKDRFGERWDEENFIKGSKFNNGALTTELINAKKEAFEYIDEKIKQATENEEKTVAELEKRYNEFLLEADEKVLDLYNKAVKKRDSNKKRTIILSSLLAIAIVATIITSAVIKSAKYNDAIDLMSAGKYREAKVVLRELDGYKDSIDKIRECNNNIYGYGWNNIDNINVGDIFIFGTYEQDNNLNNGQEDIEWIVLKKEGTKILVVSKYALDCQPYNTEYASVTWQTSTLREWLNNDFINNAFASDEIAMIPSVTVSGDKNTKYSTNAGNETYDQVFLLSVKEANTYFRFNSQRECQPTDYAIEKGVKQSTNGNCWWWLRTPGRSQFDAASVYYDGKNDGFGNSVDSNTRAVRPALWIDLDY